jgi:DnaJ-domain-containing protein 1
LNSNSRTVHKTGVLADIHLTDGSVLRGKLFMPQQGRLSDVLNDDRMFLPIENMDGTPLALAKTSIKQVSLPGPDAAPYRGNDPYTILGVVKGVSLEKLKDAYHRLCLLNHPDRIRGLGLGADYQDLGTKNMTRINGAYAELLKIILS